MADTTFSAGTVIASDWLNDVNDKVYGLDYTTLGKGSALVAHKRQVANTLAANVQSKLNERVSPDEFGADPTGATGSLTAINNAVVYLASIGGGVLDFTPGGVYKISGTINIADGVEFNLNRATIEQQTSNTPIFSPPTGVSVQKWAIRRGQLSFATQQTSVQTSAIGIRLANAGLSYDWAVEDLRVNKACDAYVCPSTTGSYAFVGRILNVIADTCARYAGNLDCDTANGANTNILMANCWALQPSGAVISTSRGWRINGLSQAQILSLFTDYVADQPFDFTNVDGYFGNLTVEASTFARSSGALSVVSMSECNGTIEQLKFVSCSFTTTSTGEIYLVRPATATNTVLLINSLVTQTNTYSGTAIYEINASAGATVKVRRAKIDRTPQLADGAAHEYRVEEWDGKPRIRRGTTAQRPTLNAFTVGYQYFDNTLAANGRLISWNGSAWVDSTGAVV